MQNRNRYTFCQNALAVFSLFMAVFASHAVSAAGWPQFQGPNRNGTSPEQGLARSWPADGPRTLWSVPMGEGFGGAAIRDGHVYVLDRVEDSRDVLRCFDLASGESIWETSYSAPGAFSYNGSRTTPTVTENYIYSVGMTGQLYCFERETGDLLWTVDLVNEFPPATEQRWGTAQSPSVYGDLVIVAPQSQKGFVVAFNRLNGEPVWTSENLGRVGYSTPVVTTLCGVDQVVMISAGEDGVGGVTGLSVDDGSVLWRYTGWGCRIPIPFATTLPDDRLFITGEYGAGSAMLRLHRTGDRFRVEEVYKTLECGSQIHQPLLHDGHLYMNSNGNNRNDGMLCMSLDGEVKWKTRDTRGLPRFERGGLLLADGLIVNFDGRRGTLHLIEPTPTGYHELASAPILKGKLMWSPIALADGKLLIRTQENLTCFDLRSSKFHKS